MRQATFGLGFFLLIACGGETSGRASDLGAAAASGEEASGGNSDEQGGRTAFGGRAESGTAGRGGTAGSGSPAGGSSPAGGPSTGGAEASGGESDGGEAGAPSAMGGTATGGVGGLANAGAGMDGSGARSPVAVCDPASGELESQPYPDCEPRDATDPCELCIQAECCVESKICYGYEPGNVCGWGGPTSGSNQGQNEIDCYVACARAYVSQYGDYDNAASICVPACTTPSCGLIGKATQDLVVCLDAHCSDSCFEP